MCVGRGLPFGRWDGGGVRQASHMCARRRKGGRERLSGDGGGPTERRRADERPTRRDIRAAPTDDEPKHRSDMVPSPTARGTKSSRMRACRDKRTARLRPVGPRFRRAPRAIRDSACRPIGRWDMSRPIGTPVEGLLAALLRCRARELARPALANLEERTRAAAAAGLLRCRSMPRAAGPPVPTVPRREWARLRRRVEARRAEAEEEDNPPAAPARTPNPRNPRGRLMPTEALGQELFSLQT